MRIYLNNYNSGGLNEESFSIIRDTPREDGHIDKFGVKISNLGGRVGLKFFL